MMEREQRMTWSKLLSANRSHGTPSCDDIRSAFEKDHDRIIFCSSFRRLGKKTQVHPLATNDHIHSRLTHSLEVASVGKTLGMICGRMIYDQNHDEINNNSIIDIAQIVQAACLAHDIGNTPFGHAGEHAIGYWFKKPESAYLLDGLSEDQQDDLKNFEGNAQSFRIMTRLERHRNNGGMRLTHATLATMLKYPWTAKHIKRHNAKFCIFQSELDEFRDIAISTGLIEKDTDRYCRHPLAFLVEAADDVCNSILDLEDACEMKLINFDEVLSILAPMCNHDNEFTTIALGDSNIYSDRRKAAYLRAKAIGFTIKPLANTFMRRYDDIMHGRFEEGALVDETEDIKTHIYNAKNVVVKKVFKERRKVTLEIGSYCVISTLLDVIIKAVREKVLTKEDNDISFKSKHVLTLLGPTAPNHDDDIYTAYLRATDYISGMTDNYASFMAKQMSGMGA